MTTAESTREPTRDEKFVHRLEGLLDDPGAMAALRRGLGRPPGAAAEMHPYILPWIANEESTWREDAYYLVASLFAYWHQGKERASGGPPENLGASFAHLRDESESIEKRFVAMLNCHADDLRQHLRHAVGLLKGKDVSINWGELLGGIRGWTHEDRYVQKRWARGFWRGQAVESQGEDAAPDA